MRKTKFITETGSVYLLEKDTLTRMLAGSGVLRRDGESIEVLEVLKEPKIGSPAVFLLNLRQDGVGTVRTTSWVTEIKDL